LPIYEFACRSCEHRFEELVKANGSSPALPCPSCGSHETSRIMSAFAVRSAPAAQGLEAALASEPAAGAGGCCGGACGCH
jgi:putative FmdB family regulatory protein